MNRLKSKLRVKKFSRMTEEHKKIVEEMINEIKEFYEEDREIARDWRCAEASLNDN